jgi:GldM C-terminal domain
MTNDCVVSVYVNEKLAGTSSFRVRNLPSPFASIGGFRSGQNIASGDLKTQAGLAVYLQDFPMDVRYEVVGFTFSVNKEKDEVATTNCEGPLFTSTVKEYISEYVKPGKTVIIDRIRVKDPGGREIKIPSLIYYIK